MDVPKSVCELEKVNPRQETRPVIKLWCDSDPPTATQSTNESSVTSVIFDFNEEISIPGTAPTPPLDYEY